MIVTADCSEEIFPRIDYEKAKVAFHPFPDCFSRLSPLQSRLKKAAGCLLNLIDRECGHHKEGKYCMKVLLPMAEVVLELVSLVLERVEGLILNLPSGSPTLHQLICILF